MIQTTPARAARNAARTLGATSPATALYDFALESCPFDLDTAEGQEWAEDLESEILDVLA